MKQILVLYGTISGNAENCANETVQLLNSAGIPARAVNMLDFPADGFANEETVLICVSTYGDGEPPFDAVSLWEQVSQEAPLALIHLQFAVLALGDTSYEKFCQCGKDFDAALSRHGARRLCPRIDCDVDYERPYRKWVDDVLTLLKQQYTASATLS